MFDLKLSPKDKERLQLLADSTKRIADAAEAILAKLNEPPEDESETQALIDDLTQRLKDANDKLEGKVTSSA